MTAVKPRPDALIVVVIMLVGWVVSVGIRTWQGVNVELVPEMTGCGLAVALVYAKISGRRSGDGGEDR